MELRSLILFTMFHIAAKSIYQVANSIWLGTSLRLRTRQYLNLGLEILCTHLYLFVFWIYSHNRVILHKPSPSWLVSMLGGLMSCGTPVHVSSWPEALSTACVTLVYYIPSVSSAMVK